MTYSIRIEYDSDPINPRTEFDCNLGTMACFSGKYSHLGDKHTLDEEDLRKIYENDKEYISLSLFLYDHSGITMNTTGFSCPWDSGRVGIIFVSREKVRKEFGVKRISKKLEERIIGYLKGEVETYDQYLTGDVWGYIIEEPCPACGDMQHVDSCWGFYGRDYCETEAKVCLEYWEKKAA